MKNLNRFVVLMLTLTLLLCVSVSAMAAVAGSVKELPLTDEWAKPTVTFTDALGNKYPEGYEFKDGDSVRFRIDLNLTGSNMWYGWGYFTTSCQHAIREAYHRGWTFGQFTTLPQIDENTEFKIPFSDLDYLKLGTNMPTSKSNANTAYDGSLPIFKWWIDENSGCIRITFTKEALESTKTIRSAFVAVTGTLDLSKAQNEDNIHFDVDDSDFDLPLATKYTLQKNAALIQEDGPAKNYKAQYTLKMSVDKDQDLSNSSLKITDVSGAFIGNPEAGSIKVTTTSGDDVSVRYENGAFIFSSNDSVLKAGEYTITYTSPLKDWNKDSLESDDGSSFNSADASNRTNTAEIVKNETPTGIKAEAVVNYTPLKDQVKIDKGNDNTGKTTLNNIYVENGNYYIDYYIDVTLKNDAKEFVVADDGGEWLAHVAENPTLLHAADAWDWLNVYSFTSTDASISYSDNGSVRTFTVKGNDTLAAGAYRLKYRMQVKPEAIKKALDDGKDVSLINTSKTISVDGRGVTLSDGQYNAVPTYKNTTKSGSVETITQADGSEVKVVKWTATYQWNFFQNGSGKVTDTITGGKLYIDSEHPFVIKNSGSQIASLSSASDAANGLTLSDTGFTYELGKLNENTAGEYVLTYYTIADVTDESTGATADTVNTIGVDYDGDGSDDGKGTGTVSGSTGEGEDPEDPNPPVDPSVPTPEEMNITKAGKVIKTDVTNKQVTVEWTASVALQEVPYSELTKFEIVDTLKPDWGKTMTFTAAPVVTVIMEDDTPVTLTENADYTVETSADGLTQKVVLFMDIVRAKAATAKSVNVVYTSLCSAEESNNFKNHADTNYKYGTFDEQTDSTDASVDQQLLLSSKVGYLNYTIHDFYNAATGSYGWPGSNSDGVNDYPYQFKLRDANFINRGVETPITLKEILPTISVGGSSVRVFDIVPGSLRISNQEMTNSWGSRNISEYNYSASSSGFELSFNVPSDWASDTVYVYFACVPTAEFSAIVKGDVYMSEWAYGDVTNTGIVSWDDQSQTLKDTQSFWLEDDRLKKSSTLVASQGGYSQINYTIKVNPQALDLVSDSDTVTLTDYFSTGASSVTYVQSSFVVKDADGNTLERSASASDNSYYLVFADDGKSFEITLPDSKALTLSYYVWPTVTAGQQTGNISNNASLAGVNKSNTVNSFTASLPTEGVSTTLIGSDRGINIQKKESGTELPLDDAEFTVYTVSTQAGETAEEANVLLTQTDKVASSSNGLAMLTFTQDELDYVYAIKETKAPEGYTASDNVWYFYFDQFDEDGNIIPPSAAMQEVIDVLGGHVRHADKAISYTFSAYNAKPAHEPTTVTLDLEKRLVVEGGALTADDTFTFELKNTAAYETYDAANTANNVAKTTGFAIKNATTSVTFEAGFKGDQTLSSAADSAFLPFEIEFTEPGTYVFTLTETKPDVPSPDITYDAKVYEIWYTVTDSEGKLTASSEVYKNSELTIEIPLFDNRHVLTSFTVKKAWNPQPETVPDISANLTLYVRTTDGEGNVKFTPVENVTPVCDSEAGSYTWNNLPMRDADGKLITYVVKEESLPGYITTYENGLDYAPDGATITNTLVKAELPIEKCLLMMNYGVIPTTPPDYAKSFRFTITPVFIPDGETVKVMSGTNELIPGEDGSYTVIIDMTSADLSNYEFCNTLPVTFEFSGFGTYEFAVSEAIPSDASEHMEYDDDLRTVRFVPHRDGIDVIWAQKDVPISAQSPLTFTNKHYAPVELEITKFWSDGVPEGFEPEDLKLQLFYAERIVDDKGNIVYPSNLSGFTRYSKVAPVVTADPNDPTIWTITCDNLPDHVDGKPVIWAIAEISVPDGYTAIYQKTDDSSEKDYALNGESIKNALNTAVGEFTLKKTLETSADLNGSYAFSFSLMPDAESDDNDALDASAYTISGMTPVMEGGALSHYETTLTVSKEYDPDSEEYEYKAEHTVSFTFSKEGTYVFKVAEIIPDNIPDGFRYDITKYAVTFKVSKDASTGRLTAVPTDGHREFVNYYSETEVLAGKLWKGGMPESTEGFEDYLTLQYAVLQFDVSFDTLDWKPYESSDVVFSIIKEQLPDEAISEIESLYGEGLQRTVWMILAEHLPRFMGGEEVIYRIREKDLPGYTASYDDETDTIINTLQKVSANFTIEKYAINATDEEKLPMNTFSFILTADGKNPAGCTAPVSPITLTVTDNGEEYTAQQKLDFTFTQPGTYTFTLKEQIPDPYPDGWGYDELTKTLIFKVKKTDGALSVETLVNDGYSEDFYPDSFASFLNWYYGYESITLYKAWRNDSPSDRPSPEDLDLTLEYRLHTGSFTEDGDPIYTAWATYPADFMIENTNTDTWTITYSALPKDIGGKQTEYRVKETTVPAGYVVSYPHSWDYANRDDVITNTLRRTSITLGGMKTLTGRDFKPGDSFTFDLYAESTDTEPIDTVTVTPESGKEIAFSFKELTYGAPDTYLYYIKERGGDIGGVIYDETAYRVVVRVSEDVNEAGQYVGAIKAEIVNPEDSIDGSEEVIVFSNTYEATGSLTFKGVKTLEGSELKDGDFSFQLKDGNGNVLQTVQNGADGTFAFDAIEYDLDDAGKAFAYTISEVIPEDAVDGKKDGVIYDPTVYEFNVTVSDNGDGTLIVTTDNYSEENGVTFLNIYNAYGELEFIGTKRFTDVNGDRSLENQVFMIDRIEQKMVDGEVVEEITDTVLVDEYGSFSFVKRPFTQEDVGTYVYTIRELIPEGADENGVYKGVVYDKTEYTFTLTVSDNGDGTLNLETEGYPENGFVFANTYEATGSLTFKGVKSLENKGITAGEFSFQLKDENGNVLQTVRNGADGTFTFDAIEYDLGDAGKTFTYTISEVIPEDAVNGKKDGVIYDPTVYEFNVTVADNGDGTLIITTDSYSEENGVTFFNTYEAAGTIALEGTKTMVGREFKEDDVFVFELVENGEVIDTAVITPTSGTTAPFQFLEMIFGLSDIGKTFSYTVREADTGIKGVSYAATTYEVSFTVVDMGNGTIGLQMLKGSIDELNFTNTYSAEGEALFAGTKTLEGKTLEAGGFTFELKDESGKVIQTAQNDDNGAFAFDAIKYDLDDAGKTFTYTISEVIPEDAVDGKKDGVTYDSTVHTVTVEVTDDGSGALTTKVSENANALTFTNTYAAAGDIQLSGSKAMTSRSFRENDSFTFELVESDKVIDSVTITPASGSVAAFSFKKIPYTLEDVGTKTYTVREVKGTIGGVTYDETVKTVTVEITDNGDGTLTAKVSEDSDKITFTNAYAADGSIVLEASKTLNGRTLEAGEFLFFISGTDDFEMTARNDENGLVTFPEITYTLDDVGTHTYFIYEDDGGKAGYTYDKTSYTVTVEVTDNGDGTLNAEASSNAQALSFINTYEAAGDIQFSGSKALTGKALEENEFSFVLSDENGEIETVTNGADGTFAFSAIKYDLDDAGKTFTYTVSEVNDGKSGVTYDKTLYTVTVDVTDNGDGTLKAAASDNAQALDFTNAYAADGSVTLSGSKKMTGRSFIQGDEFTFELVENSNVIDTATIKPTTGSIAGFFFKPIQYTLNDLGEHVYTVREKSGEIAGVAYDKTAYTVTVTVADAGEGKLEVTASDNAKKLAFTNTYAASGSAAFSGTKTLTGKALKADDFSFVLKNEAGETLQTVTNAADGSFSFDEIAYTEADAGKTFTYTVSELAGAMAGVTYDKTVHTVTVEVVDNGDGTLTAKTSQNAQALAFTNTYAADGSIAFSGSKTLTGRALEAGAFSFILTDEEGNEIETVTNDEDGAITFTRLTYGLEDAGRTFTYKVREIAGSAAGVTYDQTVYTVTVEVIDNGDGTLTASASANAQALDFTNVYTAKGSVTFSGSKTMVGRELEAGEFAFTLADEDGAILETVVNEADGSFSFTEIAYDLADAGKTFTYTVSEDNDEEPGVTYDDTVYTVTVDVTDNGDGTLKTETSANAAKLSFVNTYAADGSVVFTGTKILEGRELEAGEFSFILMDENGETLQTVTHDAAGFFAFEPIKYDLADAGKTYTYTYKVAEKAGDAAGVTYDDTVHTVVVAVTDNGDGTLTVKPSSNANKLTFTNTYEAKGVVTFSGSKTMTGRSFTEGDSFTFELLENSKVIDTVTIAPAKGSSEPFSFKEITYTTADLGLHSYTVREQKGSLGGVTYDERTYTIEVNVTDNGDGTLAMAVSPYYNALSFSNSYDAKGAYQIAGRKVYEGGELTGEDFTFTLRNRNGIVIEEIDNDENGVFAFSELAYDLDDAGKTFTYTVSEVNTAIRGVTYDETIYTVAVTVTDNGDGTLSTDAVITAGTQAASEIVFTNTLSASLTISKTVEGEETEKTFPMTISLYDADGEELTGSYPYSGDVTGTMKSGDVIRLGHGQSATITGLPVGTNYTVAEEANNAYETTVNGLGGSETDGELTVEGAAVEFVNERKLTSFSVTKRWEGGSGPIELTLYANGVKLDPQPVCSGHDDVYTFENLPMYTDDGEYITYYAKEKYVDGYVTIYVNVDPHSGETSVIYDGGTIINRPAKQLSFKVKKVWTGLDEGEKTPEITLTLYCNGEKTNVKTPKPDKNGWYKYYDLPTTVNGKPAVYTVKEEPISGFQVFYQTADGETAEYANNGGQITNAKFPKTGDDSSLAMWVALMGGCAALLALLLRRRKA